MQLMYIITSYIVVVNYGNNINKCTFSLILNIRIYHLILVSYLPQGNPRKRFTILVGNDDLSKEHTVLNQCGACKHSATDACQVACHSPKQGHIVLLRSKDQNSSFENCKMKVFGYRK